MKSNLEYLKNVELCKSILYKNDIKIYLISPTLDDSILIRFEINNKKYAFDFYHHHLNMLEHYRLLLGKCCE